MQYLGLITARAGSKRIPNKNIKSLCGKPLLSYTIEAARASTRVNRTIISTEDGEIASVALNCGAEVPFRRPKELATDDARTIDVILHAIEWLESNEGYVPDALVLLQPTCPLRTGKHIDEAIALYEECNADCVVAVSEPDRHPYWMKKMDDNGQLAPFIEVDLDRYHQKQTLPQVWSSNSSIYVIRRTSVLARRAIYGVRNYGYIMPRQDALDIDTAWDFHLAELIISERKISEPGKRIYLATG